MQPDHEELPGTLNLLPSFKKHYCFTDSFLCNQLWCTLFWNVPLRTDYTAHLIASHTHPKNRDGCSLSHNEQRCPQSHTLIPIATKRLSQWWWCNSQSIISSAIFKTGRMLCRRVVLKYNTKCTREWIDVEIWWVLTLCIRTMKLDVFSLQIAAGEENVPILDLGCFIQSQTAVKKVSQFILFLIRKGGHEIKYFH